MRLKDKVAIVTGSGRGIGRVTALALAAESADILVSDIDLESARNVAEEVKSLGRRAEAVRADVASREEVGQMVKKALDNFGKIDILVNNAGVSEPMPFFDINDVHFNKIININLRGLILCSQAAGKEMVKQRRGKIINIASQTAHRGVPRFAVYSASKAAVLAITRALAMEWAKYNINVNAVSPGMTLTAIAEQLARGNPDFIKERAKTRPLRRLNRPEEIAAVVVFLASPEADAITGQDITVDGGSDALHPSYISEVCVEG